MLKDNGGTANGGQDTSPPQSFQITVLPIDPRDVAISMASVDAGVSIVTNDVGQVSLPGQQALTWRVFQRSELNYGALALHKVILWYDPDGAQQVSPEEVALFQNLYANGKHLVFVGPKLIFYRCQSARGIASGLGRALAP